MNEAQFKAFIVSMIRRQTMRWKPKSEVKRKARVSRGIYHCAGCGKYGPATLPPPKGKKRRINNALVDHIDPVIDPAVGFVDWNIYIDRMFVEEDGLQLLCHSCHTKKTQQERDISNARLRSN